MDGIAPEKFLERLGKAEAIPAVLLLGGDLYWRDLCRAKLVEAFVPEGARDWAVARFSLAESPLELVVRQAQTLPMLAPRQVVVVQDVEAIEKMGEAQREAAVAGLAAYLDDPAPFTSLLLQAAQLDQRMRLYKLLAEKTLVVALAVGQEDSAARVFEMAQELGVRIDREAAALLSEILGGQLARICREMDKLAAFVGAGQLISPADVAELVVAAKTYSVWELAGVLATGPRRRSLEFLDSLLREGEAAPALLGALAWMYRKLLEAQELSPQTTGWQAARQLGMRPETAELALRQARQIPREKLRAGLVALSEADNRLKSGGSSEREQMEFLVAELTAQEDVPSPRREEDLQD